MKKYGNANLVERFEDWWRRDNRGLPLMEVIARRDGEPVPVPEPKNDAARYTDVDYLYAANDAHRRNHVYLADAYPQLSCDLGPGSMALYLGAEPVFAKDTVWYAPCISDMETLPRIAFDPQNKWWKLHLDMVRALKERSGGAYMVNIPDLIENIDILAAMRGPQELLFDLMDEPENVERAIAEIDDLYFLYYDAMREIVKNEEDVSSYTAFSVMGRGRVAKIQCDFSAMISTEHFRRFVLPSLKKQAKRLDHSVYHLDGPDAIRHVPALMEIEALDALQWTCGAGQPDGAYPGWFGIYDQVRQAGKGLWIQLYDGGIDDWIRSADVLIDRYGTKPIYLHFPVMSLREADRLMEHAEKCWR